MKETLNNGTMKAGQTVSSKMHGTGTIISIEGSKAIVDFNGVEKIMMIFLLKAGEAKDTTSKKLAKTIARQETKLSVADVASMIQGNRDERHSSWSVSPLWSKVMEVADNQVHYVSEIVEAALNGESISNKQAFAVASFAKNNGLLNA